MEPSNVSPTLWGALVGGVFLILSKVLEAPLSRLMDRAKRRQQRQEAADAERIKADDNERARLEARTQWLMDQLQKEIAERTAGEEALRKRLEERERRLEDLEADRKQWHMIERQLRDKSATLERQLAERDATIALLHDRVATLESQLSGVTIVPPKPEGTP